MYSLGAVDSVTNEYTQPADADSTKVYKCIECDQRVIPRKGQVRRHHFAHYALTNTCTYYEHPNESQLHKDSKYKLAEWLQNTDVLITWNCNKCTMYKCREATVRVKCSDIDKVVTEYRDPNGKYVADVAALKDGIVKYIFEVKYTHATKTPRPEPWFEFTTEEIQNSRYDTDSSGVQFVQLWCCRSGSKRECAECRTIQSSRYNTPYDGPKFIEGTGKRHADYIAYLNEPWLRNMPQLPYKVGDPTWKQVNPCIKCGCDGYNPVFIRSQGYLQICKICLSDHEDTLKSEYHAPKCMISFRQKKN